MAEISFAACASHAPGLAGWFDKAPEDAPWWTRHTDGCTRSS